MLRLSGYDVMMVLETRYDSSARCNIISYHQVHATCYYMRRAVSRLRARVPIQVQYIEKICHVCPNRRLLVSEWFGIFQRGNNR